MAKKKSGESEGVNKSKAIKDYMAQNPGVLPKAVAAALGEQGIVVTPGYVSMIKSSVKSKKGGRGGAKGAVRSAGGRSGGISLAALEQAKEVARQLGGVKEAQKVLDALARLME